MGMGSREPGAGSGETRPCSAPFEKGGDGGFVFGAAGHRGKSKFPLIPLFQRGKSPVPGSRLPAPGSRLQPGFTLIEVLLATVLLAAGLALAFATLRASTATVERGEALAARSERMRAVEGFLRRRLASAQPIGFATDTSTGNVLRFVGEPERMRFVADLPDYLGRGGPHLHDFAVYDDGDGARLAVSFAMVLAGETVEEERPRPPEPLVPDLREVRFRYRGLDAENDLTEWMDTWEAVDQLPLQVSVEIVSAGGGVWPPLVVALPQSTGGTGSAIGTGESGSRSGLGSRLRRRR
jgi:general secretion pathway protein J